MNEGSIDFAKFTLNLLGVETEGIDWNDVKQKYQETRMLSGRPGLMYINWHVADYFGYDSLLVASGNGQKAKISIARQICYYIAYDRYDYKHHELQAFFNKKAHGTIISGIKRCKNLMDTDKDFKETVDKIIHKIKYGNYYQTTDSNNSTGEIPSGTEPERYDLSEHRHGEIESCNRLHEENGSCSCSHHLTQDEPEGELEERVGKMGIRVME